MAKTNKTESKIVKKVKNVSEGSKIIKKKPQKVNSIVKAQEETKKEEIVKPSNKKTTTTKNAGTPQAEKNEGNTTLGGKGKPKKVQDESTLEKIAKKRAKKIAQKLKKKQVKTENISIRKENKKKVEEKKQQSEGNQQEIIKSPQKKGLGKKIPKKAANAINGNENG